MNTEEKRLRHNENQRLYRQRNRDSVNKRNLAHYHNNRERYSEYGKKHYLKYSQQAKDYQKWYRTNFPDKVRNTKLKGSYGISLAQYNQILSEQGGKCAICGNVVKVFHADHCHSTNQVRGLLCHYCNLGLGSFKDNMSSLTNAILYLSGFLK